MKPHHVRKEIESYQRFSRKLVLTNIFSIVLSGALTALVKELVGGAAPIFPTWMFACLEITLASLGLFWLTKNVK
ncbi:MAG: hypothetical protein WC488_02925 [Candidatus Micrarchaeia archaeon]